MRNGMARLWALSIPSLLLCAGCAHPALDAGTTYSLEGHSGYSFLVPSIQPRATDGDFQEFAITLAGKLRRADSARMKQCSVQAPVYSLLPNPASNAGQWTLRTLSVQGWEHRGNDYDPDTEWTRFTHDIQLLQSQGCFPAEESLFGLLRKISEKIPVPSSEALLFRYSMGRAGFADLAPGMEIVVDRIVPESERGTKADPDRSGHIETRFEVVAQPPAGVAIRRASSEKRPTGTLPGDEAEAIDNLPSSFADRPALRLFLFSITDDNKHRPPLLLGAANATALDEAAQRIRETNPWGCPAPPLPDVSCVLFKEGTSVSLLSSVWINGKLAYRPVGTTAAFVVGMLPENERARALATVELKRPMAAGGLAEVKMTKDWEGLRQIILLSGDRLSWSQ